MPGARTGWTDRVKKKFLDVLRDTANVSASARAVGHSRSGAYEQRNRDPKFAEDWAEAEQEAVDRLEGEAWRRAYRGVEKPITFQGSITATYYEYSDRMMELLLKAHRPEKFKDRSSNEIMGPGGGPVQLSWADLMRTAESADEDDPD